MSIRKVTFHKGRSDAEALEKARRFAPVFERLAAIWDVNVSVDAPDGKPIFPVEGKESDVFVHIYSFAGNPDETSPRIMMPKLLGWEVPKPPGTNDEMGITITGRGVGAGLNPSGKAGGAREVKGIETIRAPESTNAPGVAEVVSSNIYILFDLAYEEWEGDVPVLWHTLSAALAKLRGNAAWGETWAREMLLYNTQHETLVEELKEDGKERFMQVSRRALFSCLTASEKEQGEKRGVEEQALKAIHKLGVERMVVEAYLRHGNRFAAVPFDAGEQFDTLLSWEVIKGVRVEDRVDAADKDEETKTMEDKRIVVYTNPLTMELSNGRTFLIGEYKIIIEPVLPSTATTSFVSNMEKWMQAAEVGWRGPYQHGHITSTEATQCWGTNEVKLNVVVANALMESNFVFAIQDILVFLTAETAGGKGEPTEEDLLVEPPPPTTLYEDLADQSEERNQFVKFTEYFRAKSTKEAKQKRKEEIEKEHGTKMEEFLKARVSLGELAHRVAFLGQCMENVPLEQEYADLLQDKNLVSLRISESAIWASFGPMMDGATPPKIQGGVSIRLTEAGEIKAYGMEEMKLVSGTLDTEYPLLNELIELGMLGTAIRMMRELIMGVHRLHYTVRSGVVAILADSGKAAAEEVAPETGP